MTALLAALVGMSLAVGPASAGPLAADAAGPPIAAGAVYVDSAVIYEGEGPSASIWLEVEGSLPTPCHRLAWDVQDGDGVIDVRIWSEVDPKATCAQVLEPFEATIPLGTAGSTHYSVRVNGEAVGMARLGPDLQADVPTLIGAGWSFGMCGGYCVADLALTGTDVVLTGHGHIAGEPLYVQHGRLSPLAEERLATITAAIDVEALQPVSGCPDCADGGAAYLTLGKGTVGSRYEMEFANPPPELAELYDVAMSLISSLETCASTELVSIVGECEPPDVLGTSP